MKKVVAQKKIQPTTEQELGKEDLLAQLKTADDVVQEAEFYALLGQKEVTIYQLRRELDRANKQIAILCENAKPQSAEEMIKEELADAHEERSSTEHPEDSVGEYTSRHSETSGDYNSGEKRQKKRRDSAQAAVRSIPRKANS